MSAEIPRLHSRRETITSKPKSSGGLKDRFNDPRHLKEFQEYYDNPGAAIRQQLEARLNEYDKRSTPRYDREQYHWSKGRMEEVTTWGILDQDEELSSIVNVIDEFGNASRKIEDSRSYIVTNFDETGKTIISIGAADETEVYRLDDKGKDKYTMLDGEARDEALFDHFLRRLHDEEWKKYQDQDAIDAADTSAKEKIETYLYGGKKARTPME